METSTEIFIVRPADYARAYIRQRAGMWALGLALPVLVALIAGCYDMRWWIVGLIVLMLVYPMVLSMVWFSLTGRSDMAIRLRPQQWTFSNGREIHIDFFRFDMTDDPSPVASIDITAEESEPSGKFTAVKPAAGSGYDFLLIPSSMLPDSLLNLYSE